MSSPIAGDGNDAAVIVPGSEAADPIEAIAEGTSSSTASVAAPQAALRSVLNMEISSVCGGAVNVYSAGAVGRLAQSYAASPRRVGTDRIAVSLPCESA